MGLATKEELTKGFQIKQYRKLGMRWCKLSHMYQEDEVVLKRYVALYREYIDNGGKPLNKELDI